MVRLCALISVLLSSSLFSVWVIVILRGRTSPIAWPSLLTQRALINAVPALVPVSGDVASSLASRRPRPFVSAKLSEGGTCREGVTRGRDGSGTPVPVDGTGAKGSAKVADVRQHVAVAPTVACALLRALCCPSANPRLLSSLVATGRMFLIFAEEVPDR